MIWWFMAKDNKSSILFKFCLLNGMSFYLFFQSILLQYTTHASIRLVAHLFWIVVSPSISSALYFQHPVSPIQVNLCWTGPISFQCKFFDWQSSIISVDWYSKCCLYLYLTFFILQYFFSKSKRCILALIVSAFTVFMFSLQI